jgi:ferredoxin-NADP reductase
VKVNVKGHIRDLLAFKGLVSKRQKRFAQAPATIIPVDPMNRLAQALHPPLQHLEISDWRDETSTSRTFVLRPDPQSDTKELAYFRAGQYLSVKEVVEGVKITRPYSISSAPFSALGQDGFYEITVRHEPGGFMSQHIWANWRVGAKITTSGPCGDFVYESIRDSHKIVALAGGSGITPFRSMAREIVHGDMDAELLLLYGSSDEQDILFLDEFQRLHVAAPDKVRVVHVLSCEEVSMEGCETGFITAETIRRHADVDNSTFFVCGPAAMYAFLAQELADLDLSPRRLRQEVRGEIKDVTAYPGFPAAAAGQTCQIVVQMAGASSVIVASATETVLVALERANLAPPSQCRSGECGFCRSLLLSGEVFALPDSDGRRAADKRLGYFHPCASYPVSNLEIVVPRDR